MSPDRIAILGLAVAVAAALAVRTDPRGGGPAPTAPCGTAKFRQFDFFAGDWDAYDAAAPTEVVARTRVTIGLGGCVLHEAYEQRDGLVGESFSIYDETRDAWHQTWVTNRGGLLLLDGGPSGDRMVLTATERRTDGTTSLLRGVWQPQEGEVRETAERSSDDGKTWKPVFDIVFRPHGRPPPP